MTPGLQKLTIISVLFSAILDRLIMIQNNGITIENTFNIYNYVNNVQFNQNLIVLLFNSDETHRVEIDCNCILIIIAIINVIVCMVKNFNRLLIAN